MGLKPAVFLDRDGVINVFPGHGKYVLDWNHFQFMPQVGESLLRLREAGFTLVLVTSQSCIGRGLMTQATLDAIHARMQEGLGSARFDALYFCPHHPDDGCPCRKPSPRMIQQAAREHGLDVTRSFVIGDTLRDIVMGRAAGCRTVLCGQELPRLEDVPPEERADWMCATLVEAVDWVLRTSGFPA